MYLFPPQQHFLFVFYMILTYYIDQLQRKRGKKETEECVMSVFLCFIENFGVWIANLEDGYSVFWRVLLNFGSLSHIKFFSVMLKLFLVFLTSNNRKESNY